MAENKNRERGLKSALHNPRVSEEAKQHDRELLASEFGENLEQPQAEQTGKRRGSASKKSSSTGPHSHTTEGQAQMGSASGGQAGQATGRKARRASSGDAGGLQSMSEEKDKGNVIRGLKAALKNPHVSEEAKNKDRKKLRELGETVE